MPPFGNLFETINMLTWCHTISHNSADDNLDDDFSSNDWIMDADEPQACNDLAAPLSILEMLQEQNNDQVC